MKRFVRVIVTFVMLLAIGCFFMPEVKAEGQTGITYSVHTAQKGWNDYYSNGTIAGTVGESRQVEAIKIKLINTTVSGDVCYRSHVENEGWEAATHKNDEISGTTGKGLSMQAIEIYLDGEIKELYDIYYRVHVQEFGWLGWAKNGEYAGTIGYNYRMEAIQIKLVKKGVSFSEYGDEVRFYDGNNTNVAEIPLYISDIKIIGMDNASQKEQYFEEVIQQGYSIIGYEPIEYSFYRRIYICYKTTTNYQNAIKDIYSYTGKNIAVLPNEITNNNQVYSQIPYIGSQKFLDSKGNVTGIKGLPEQYIYYTRDEDPKNKTAISSITVNNIQTGAKISFIASENVLLPTPSHIHITKTGNKNMTLVKTKNQIYIKDILLVGKDNSSTQAIKTLEDEGYTVINYDLNHRAGGDYIYLGYKTTTNYGEAIKDLMIFDGENYRSNNPVKYKGRNYQIAPYKGDSHFVGMMGDLNSHAGGASIYLYYTREENAYKMAVKNITINNDPTNALGGIDLNKKAGGDDIFMHITKLDINSKTFLSEISPSEWMSYIDDNVKITDINIPGAHDAGTVHTTAVYPASIYTVCQDYHIGSQSWEDASIFRSNKTVTQDGLLERGVRYFDLRYGLKDKSSNYDSLSEIAKASDRLKLVHGGFTCQTLLKDGSLGAVNTSFAITSNDVLMKWIKSFLDKNKYETVILDLSSDDGDNSAQAERYAYEFFMKQALNPDPNYPEVYVGDHVPTMGEARGKVVLLSDFNTNNYWYYQHPDYIEMWNRKYTRSPYDGSEVFIKNQGNINSLLQSGGTSLTIYETRDTNGLSTAITSISFNDKKDGSVGGINIRKISTGPTVLYMHTTSAGKDSNSTFIKEVKVVGGYDGDYCIDKLKSEGYTVVDGNLGGLIFAGYSSGFSSCFLGYKTTTNYDEALKDIRPVENVGWWRDFTIKKDNKTVIFAFSNGGGYGDTANKTYGKVSGDDEYKYSVYKDNKYDELDRIGIGDKWTWISNGLKDAEKIKANEAKNNNDAFLLLYTTANNVAKADIFGTPKYYAEKLNPKIVDFINHDIFSTCEYRLYGIIAMDYIDAVDGAKGISRTIWETNFYREVTNVYANTKEITVPTEKYNYNVLNDNKPKFSKASQANIQLDLNGDDEYYVSILIDDKDVSAENYSITLYDGETDDDTKMSIDISQDYLNTLSDGTHTIKVVYLDGYAESEFEIVGDYTGLWWIISGSVLALMMASVTGIYLFKTRKKKTEISE